VSITRRQFFGAAAAAGAAGTAAYSLADGGTALARGIDVSHWQGQIGWLQVGAAGYDFAFAKATEGTTYKDATYPLNRSGAPGVGVKVGAYHFARPAGGSDAAAVASAVAQADHFVDYAQPARGDLLPVLDLESRGGLSTARLVGATDVAQVKFGSVMWDLGNQGCSVSFWKSSLGDTPVFAQAGHRLWIAHWTKAALPILPGAGWGGLGEYVCVPERVLATMPARLSFEQAAAVPQAGVLALQGLSYRGAMGEEVLLNGAGGGVGTFAVQIAKDLGAHVTAVASTQKLDLVRSLGADQVIDYTTTDIADDGGRYDLVLDIGGNRPLSRLRRVLTSDGVLVIVGGEGGGRWTGGIQRQLGAMVLSLFVRQRLGTFIAKPNSTDLDALRALIEAGSVTPAVDRVITLEEIPDAIRDLAHGHVRGKVVMANETASR